MENADLCPSTKASIAKTESLVMDIQRYKMETKYISEHTNLG